MQLCLVTICVYFALSKAKDFITTNAVNGDIKMRWENKTTLWYCFQKHKPNAVDAVTKLLLLSWQFFWRGGGLLSTTALNSKMISIHNVYYTFKSVFFIFTCTFCERGGGALAPFWDESAKRRLQGCLFCSPVISGGGGVSATPEKLLTFDQQLPWGWFLPQFPLGKDAACLCWPTSDRRCRHNLKNVMEISSRGLQGPRNFWECHWGEHQRLPMWMSLLQVPHLFETICCLFCLDLKVYQYITPGVFMVMSIAN